MKKIKILVTGCAGFIGFHLSNKLLKYNKYNIFGIDNINSYYDVKLKKDRLKILNQNKNFKFSKIDLTNSYLIKKNFKANNYDVVINLAAQAGVRYSIENPSVYLSTNVNGFFNILDASRENKLKHLIFASTSSVYGASNKFPLSENLHTSKPLSFYAATKKTNEVMAYAYSNIYNLPCTGLRFFTVYGPYGRPDMALFKFTNLIKSNKKIDLFNNGNHYRDFTYIDDIVDGIVGIIETPSQDKIPFNVFNIGSNKPKYLKVFLSTIEKIIGKKAKINNKKLQKGDVFKTHASISKLYKKSGYKPKVSIQQGIKNFIEWYNQYYNK